MNQEERITSIERNSTSLAAAARRGMNVPIPTCPGWNMADLVVHIGSVHRNWTRHLEEHSRDPVEVHPEIFASVPGLLKWAGQSRGGGGDPNTLPPGVMEWFEQGFIELADVFRRTDPNEVVWHWSGDNRVLSHLRMQAVETALHRRDAELAHGIPHPIGTDLAAEGIDHYFEVMLPACREWDEPSPGSGESYHFHRTDGPGEWLVKFDGGNVEVRREHAKGDVAVRGPAEDLFLWLWGRRSQDSLDVHGDSWLLGRFRELVPAP